MESRFESLWLETVQRQTYPALQSDIDADVVVVGGGIAGLMAAYYLQKAGKHVIVLEALRLLEGTTGYTTAKVTLLHGLKYDFLISTFGEEAARAYVDSNRWAIDALEKIISEESIDCDFRRVSGFVFTQEKDQVKKIEHECNALKKLGQPAVLRDAQIGLPFSVLSALELPDQAIFHPASFLLRLAELFVKRGGRIFEKTRVEKIEDGEVCRVTTETATATARSVVVATNYPVHDPSFFFARLDQHRSYALALRTDETIQDNMFIGAGDSEITVRTQYVDGKQLILVGGETHPTASTSATVQKYHQLEEKTRKLFTVRSVDYHWSAQDSSPLDRVPLIGRMPGQKHVYVATGFGEWGMTTGIVSGKMLSDLILKSSSPWEKLYDPSRLNLRAAIGQLPEMGKQVLKGFGRYMASGSTGPEKLKPGEGTVINHSGKKLALSRLENGKLCALSAVCTHLGCLVDWNTAERTSDCPCHGSRFAATGEVIHGPAVKPLKQEEVTE